MGKNFGSLSACSILLIGLPLEAEGGSFSPRLSHAAAVVSPVLQIQSLCPADPQAWPILSQKVYYPVLGKDAIFPALVGCLAKGNTGKPPLLLQISVCTKPATGIQFSACDPNPPMNTSYL